MSAPSAPYTPVPGSMSSLAPSSETPTSTPAPPLNSSSIARRLFRSAAARPSQNARRRVSSSSAIRAWFPREPRSKSRPSRLGVAGAGGGVDVVRCLSYATLSAFPADTRLGPRSSRSTRARLRSAAARFSSYTKRRAAAASAGVLARARVTEAPRASPRREPRAPRGDDPREAPPPDLRRNIAAAAEAEKASAASVSVVAKATPPSPAGCVLARVLVLSRATRRRLPRKSRGEARHSRVVCSRAPPPGAP